MADNEVQTDKVYLTEARTFFNFQFDVSDANYYHASAAEFRKLQVHSKPVISKNYQLKNIFSDFCKASDKVLTLGTTKAQNNLWIVPSLLEKMTWFAGFDFVCNNQLWTGYKLNDMACITNDVYG